MKTIYKILAAFILVVSCYYYYATKYTGPMSLKAPANAEIVNFTFEDGMQNWGPLPNVKVFHEMEKTHSGSYGLEVVGTSHIGDWAFAASKRMRLGNGTKYHFSGWLLVDSISSPQPAPQLYLRIGLYTDGKWLRNIFTTKYNLSKLGTWENFSADFETPTEGRIDFCIDIDKKTKDKEIQLVSYVDDLRVQAI